MTFEDVIVSFSTNYAFLCAQMFIVGCKDNQKKIEIKVF